MFFQFYAFKICFRRSENISVILNVPITISEWKIQGFFLSEQRFCASDPILLKAFKSLFVECHLPTSLRRLEQTTVACTVYNHRESQFKSRVFNYLRWACSTSSCITVS